MGLAARRSGFETGDKLRGTGRRRHRAIDEQTAGVSLASYAAATGESIANLIDLLVRLNASHSNDLS
jgi:hypothetical protein